MRSTLCLILLPLSQRGGGIFSFAGTLLLSLTIMRGNDAPAGRAVFVAAGDVTYLLPAPAGYWLPNAWCHISRNGCDYADGGDENDSYEFASNYEEAQKAKQQICLETRQACSLDWSAPVGEAPLYCQSPTLTQHASGNRMPRFLVVSCTSFHLPMRTATFPLLAPPARWAHPIHWNKRQVRAQDHAQLGAFAPRKPRHRRSNVRPAVIVLSERVCRWRVRQGLIRAKQVWDLRRTAQSALPAWLARLAAQFQRNVPREASHRAPAMAFARSVRKDIISATRAGRAASHAQPDRSVRWALG
jgi:hypothetical protein